MTEIVMPSILGIDPGPIESGWCILDAMGGARGGVVENADARILVREFVGDVAIEYIAGMGQAAGQETFDTCVWIGRYIQTAVDSPFVKRVIPVYRREVKMYLCGNMQAKDPNVRVAVMDKFPRTGGGACPQKGTKKQPGPLFGFSSHAWSALAVAITARDTK